MAFNFNHGTYSWVYEKDDQKALYEVATQKMIPLELKQAGLNKRILT